MKSSGVFRTILTIGLLFAVVFIVGSVVSCQSQAPASPAPEVPAAGPGQIEVTIEDFAFKPADITVAVGSTVTWHNKDAAAHTATARDKSFDSGIISQDGTYSYTFTEKGTFEYYCTVHPYMTGQVTVE
jgi:plastocyanin